MNVKTITIQTKRIWLCFDMDIKRMVYLKPRKTPHLKFLSFFFWMQIKREKKFQQNLTRRWFQIQSLLTGLLFNNFFFFLSNHLFQMHDFSPFPAPIPKVGRRPQTFGKCGIIPVLLVKITAVSLYGTQLLGWRLPWVSV